MKLLDNLDLQKHELLNAVIEKLSAPPEGVEGLVYFDTTKHEFGCYNGTAWVYSATLAEATETTLGGVKLAGDLKGGTGAAPHVTNLHLEGDTAINHKLTSVTDPTNPQDAATLKFVLGKVNGLSWKQHVQLATFGALPAYTHSGTGETGTLEANANGALTVDGVAVTVGMRIFVTQAVEEKHNGIYEVTQAGGAGEKYKLVRSSDADTGALLENAAAFVQEGTEYATQEFVVSDTGAINIDVTAVKVIDYSSGTSVVGDGTYTTRTGNTIALKPNTAVPAVPAEGAVSAVGSGAVRVKRFAITGNAAKTEFEAEHKLGTKLLLVQCQENAAGEPTAPVEIDWEPVSTEIIKIKFVTAPAKGTSYFVTVMG
jgi:hypothetical protein